MLRTLMKSKLHRATVTDANLHDMGSLTLDPDLIKAADIWPHERHEPRVVFCDEVNRPAEVAPERAHTVG